MERAGLEQLLVELPEPSTVMSAIGEPPDWVEGGSQALGVEVSVKLTPVDGSLTVRVMAEMTEADVHPLPVEHVVAHVTATVWFAGTLPAKTVV
jgi:hypothetical protein